MPGGWFLEHNTNNNMATKGEYPTNECLLEQHMDGSDEIFISRSHT